MARRILVTGGAGFIGSHIVEAHLAAGDDVTVVDDLSTGRRDNVPAAAGFVQSDIRSPEARELVAKGRFDVLSHHAAQMDVRRSVADPVFDAEVNIIGFLNLLEGAREGRVRRIILASSGGVVYGENGAMPFAETTAKFPLSPYGTAKLASEYYLAIHARLYDVETVALRYSNVYGPRQRHDGEAGVVAIFSRRLLAGDSLTIFGDGEQTRDMVFVGDVARANLAASTWRVAAPDDIDARAFNIGTGVETTVNRLAQLIGAAAGRAPVIHHAPARPGELRRNALAVERAARELDWCPRTPLAEGLRATVHALQDR
jgi:UDP-glucose 4-epimerase